MSSDEQLKRLEALLAEINGSDYEGDWEEEPETTSKHLPKTDGGSEETDLSETKPFRFIQSSENFTEKRIKSGSSSRVEIEEPKTQKEKIEKRPSDIVQERDSEDLAKKNISIQDAEATDQKYTVSQEQQSVEQSSVNDTQETKLGKISVETPSEDSLSESNPSENKTISSDPTSRITAANKKKSQKARPRETAAGPSPSPNMSSKSPKLMLDSPISFSEPAGHPQIDERLASTNLTSNLPMSEISDADEALNNLKNLDSADLKPIDKLAKSEVKDLDVAVVANFNLTHFCSIKKLDKKLKPQSTENETKMLSESQMNSQEVMPSSNVIKDLDSAFAAKSRQDDTKQVTQSLEASQPVEKISKFNSINLQSEKGNAFGAPVTNDASIMPLKIDKIKNLDPDLKDLPTSFEDLHQQRDEKGFSKELKGPALKETENANEDTQVDDTTDGKDARSADASLLKTQPVSDFSSASASAFPKVGTEPTSELDANFISISSASTSLGEDAFAIRTPGTCSERHSGSKKSAAEPNNSAHTFENFYSDLVGSLIPGINEAENQKFSFTKSQTKTDFADETSTGPETQDEPKLKVEPIQDNEKGKPKNFESKHQTSKSLDTDPSSLADKIKAKSPELSIILPDKGETTSAQASTELSSDGNSVKREPETKKPVPKDDPDTVYLYVSLASGVRGSMGRFNKASTILKSYDIDFVPIEITLNERAKRLWKLKGVPKNKVLPAVFRDGDMKCDFNELVEANEIDDVEDLIFDGL